MQQYFLDYTIDKQKDVMFNEEQLHHITRVLRMKPHEIVKVVDKKKHAFLVEIKFEPHLHGHIIESLVVQPDAIEITLVQGLMKGDRFDFLIQKACELGVHTIIPMVSKRSVVKLNDKSDKKTLRYNKIALEACEQSKREHLTVVKDAITLRDVVHLDADVKLVAYELADMNTERLKDVLKKHKDCKHIIVVVGCEGGFDETEVSYLQKHEYICVSLGKNILRAETAGIHLVSSIMYEFE